MILNYIIEVQSEFHDDLLGNIFLEKITDYNFDGFFSNSLLTFAPIYLPVFHRDGDLYGIHLGFDNDWKKCPWIKLSHDIEYPYYLTSCFKYFPYVLLDGLLNIKRYYDEIIEPISSILERNNLETPKRDYFEVRKNDYFSIISENDPLNYILKLYKKTGNLFEEVAYNFVNDEYKKEKSNKYLNASMLILNNSLNKEIDLNEAISLLKEEFSYSLYSMLWLGGINTGAELLNEIKNIVKNNIDENDPFYLLKDFDYTNENIVVKLIEISEIFNKKNDYITALNQIRNAAMIAGCHGNGITKELCEKLAIQSELIQKGSIAAKLASYAIKTNWLKG